MKIIDKTPLQDAKGDISFTNRIQGTLKYGMNWFADLQAQKAVISQLDKMIEKGFVLIRNFTLPNSEIVIPIILVGAGGMYVIHVTSAKGFFEAKGDQWNTVVNEKSQPASINQLTRVDKLAGAFEKYLKSIKVDLQGTRVEPILVMADPGAHVDSMRPIARVVMSDAIKQFATTLQQARPIWRTDFVYDVAERIVDPNAHTPQPEPSVSPPAQDFAEQQPVSRAKAIFNASDQAQGFNPNDLGFAFEEEAVPPAAETMISKKSAPTMAANAPARPSAPKKRAGMSMAQIALLAGMGLVECCVLIGFAYLIFASQ